jgi:acetylornithine deacetylase/succinyl-diaminopimelate desuccinylase-like protein
MSTMVGPDPVPILQDLIRFDTTNPPGAERACVQYVADLLATAGAGSQLVGLDPERPNLVARIPGDGLAPGLVLQAHADVVPTTGQVWSRPPLCGEIVDGHVFGRGSVDMKGGLAMMLAALLRLRGEGRRPAGDVILAVVADEEAGSAFGAHYLVREHPDAFSGARYCLGEDGGAGLNLGGRRIHPIVVAEKRAGWLRATLRGAGGHGSRRRPDTAVSQLAALLSTLYARRLPTHITPAADRMLEVLASALPEPLSGQLQALRRGGDADVGGLLAGLPADDAVYLDSVTRHTANPTIVRTSEKINMIPSEVTVDIDGRILPGGYTLADFLAEVRELTGPRVELELLLEGEPMPDPTFGPFYHLLVKLVHELDPPALAVPMLTPASTDARLFAQLGLECYGWLPMRLPAGSRYHELLHAADERIPVDSVRFGAESLYQLLLRYR